MLMPKRAVKMQQPHNQKPQSMEALERILKIENSIADSTHHDMATMSGHLWKRLTIGM